MSEQDELIRKAIEATLPGLDETNYGERYREDALEIYKTYLEMADKISDRREKANSFFLAVNAALIAYLAKDAFGGVGETPRAFAFLAPVAAMVLCYLWYRIVRAYKDLNSAKFKVVHAMERQLPFRPFDAEWEGVGRGRNPTLYLPFTHIEQRVPWIFFFLHGVLALHAVPWSTLCPR
jgi:hypothetical protein